MHPGIMRGLEAREGGKVVREVLSLALPISVSGDVILQN